MGPDLFTKVMIGSGTRNHCNRNGYTMLKKKQSAVTSTGRFLARFQSITRWVHENRNWIYIAIIGFCLSVTIIYKISHYYGS